MKKLIAILFVSICSMAEIHAMGEALEKFMTTHTTTQEVPKLKTKRVKRHVKITPVTIESLDPEKAAGKPVMGWLNAAACGASGKELCAVIENPTGTHTHYVKEVSTRGRKGHGFVGDIEGSRKHISGRNYKVLRVYKADGTEPFMASETRKTTIPSKTYSSSTPRAKTTTATKTKTSGEFKASETAATKPAAKSVKTTTIKASKKSTTAKPKTKTETKHKTKKYKRNKKKLGFGKKSTKEKTSKTK